MPSRPAPSRRDARAIASLIADAFADYDARFGDITRRAQRRFAQCDWTGAQADAVARIDLYEQCVGETLARLDARFGDRLRARMLWNQVRDAYAGAIAERLDCELDKTFFNSLSRRLFGTRGADARLEFLAVDIEPTDRITHPVARHVYVIGDDLATSCGRLLRDHAFVGRFADLEASARALAAALRARSDTRGRAIELLRTVFYRERRAYLVGRIFDDETWAPLVVALTNGDGGVAVDAVLTERRQVSMLFGFARSYFHADLPTVGDAVVFLRTLMPHKPVDEIYAVLGRAKQAKTERYRRLLRHLQLNPDERFVVAEGERGLVMQVFTLPTYPIVFKLIRDRFGYGKSISRAGVIARYRLVARHDRVGRLVDAQEFRELRFAAARFEPALLDALLAECSETVYRDGGEIVLRHCYIERRLRPLNLYLREVDEAAALAAALDYGQAIKDLARSGIFPGDMLLKNFGVSRNGRAIFYDYDELCPLEACSFRRLPALSGDEALQPLEDVVYAAEGDVFPEEFARFLGLAPALREAFVAAHPELFDPDWWRGLQAARLRGEAPDVPPYPDSARTAVRAQTSA
ncbi:bifunctional isocitrate dehydrogenase kinase/phosphatase [Coralloluteibacterium stylophorae]|uniref:Isocitrate dehydrogenase kinase/phosphatase n=1 Tax=Coralloluteibacterium stylophorae TaxID=1776034 RepID=A0A8J7VSX9_9GAMM|nr:bifunctional isocitrate dehydrogenase kinase/phosphatase [Coralloluteibacterium stylophorae]MBS7458143.1 bifunctional isocitrate dehydrogenase kinase/phosphatase [Coralloluteibacterium stylophorae]